MKKTYTRILGGVLAAVVAAGVFTLGYFTSKWTEPEGLGELEQILRLIENNYDGEFDRDDFIHGAVAASLDRYSTYYSPSEYEQEEQSREGRVSGRLGLSFLKENGVSTNKIYSVSGNSPAERAGIEAGGRVVALANEDGTNSQTVEDYDGFSAALGRFTTDEKMLLTVKNADGTQTTYTLKREDYIESYVWYQTGTEAYNVADGSGGPTLQKRQKPLKSHIKQGFAYVKFSSFNGNAAAQLNLAVDKAAADGAENLILDLRGNGGGSMSVLTDIAGRFIPGKGARRVSVAKYKDGSRYYFNTKTTGYENLPFTAVYVLADGGTASASEALIGAMLDYDDKNLIRIYLEDGKSYGKGIMQTTFVFGGGALKLTTAHIYWPKSGTTIQGVGITPSLSGFEDKIFTVPSQEGTDAVLDEIFA